MTPLYDYTKPSTAPRTASVSFSIVILTVFDGSVEVLKKLESAGITYVRASVFLSVELPLTVTLALVVVALVG